MEDKPQQRGFTKTIYAIRSKCGRFIAAKPYHIMVASQMHIYSLNDETFLSFRLTQALFNEDNPIQIHTK